MFQLCGVNAGDIDAMLCDSIDAINMMFGLRMTALPA
jgi:hypothetical protein